MTTHKQVIAAMLAASLINPNFVALNEWRKNKDPINADPLDAIESLELEYELIQEKKSKLSRANRDRVVYIVEHIGDIPDE